MIGETERGKEDWDIIYSLILWIWTVLNTEGSSVNKAAMVWLSGLYLLLKLIETGWFPLFIVPWRKQEQKDLLFSNDCLHWGGQSGRTQVRSWHFRRVCRKNTGQRRAFSWSPWKAARSRLKRGAQRADARGRGKEFGFLFKTGRIH